MTKLRNTLRVEGRFSQEFPDAGNLIHLREGQAQRLACMAWHRTDLSFALQCLESLEQMSPSDREDTVEGESLWRSSILHYCKCFGAPQGGNSTARRQLNAPSIYGKSGSLLPDHWMFMRVRNKHLVHDEGVFSSAHVVAVISRAGEIPKVRQVVVAAADSITLVEENIGKLVALVRRSSDWVEKEFQALVDGIALTLEQSPHEELLRTREGKMRFSWEKKKELKKQEGPS